MSVFIFCRSLAVLIFILSSYLSMSLAKQVRIHRNFYDFFLKRWMYAKVHYLNKHLGFTLVIMMVLCMNAECNVLIGLYFMNEDEDLTFNVFYYVFLFFFHSVGTCWNFQMLHSSLLIIFIKNPFSFFLVERSFFFSPTSHVWCSSS